MKLSCQIVRTNRKTAAFSITRDGQLQLRIPLWVSDSEAKRLIAENQNQLRALLERWKKSQANAPIYRDEDIPWLKELANRVIPPRVDYWSRRMELSPTSVKITSAKTRFGSCSNRGSICFSCFLMLYPASAIDCVIVHELCHLKHLNHSPAFYRLMAQYLPDYKAREAILKGKQ